MSKKSMLPQFILMAFMLFIATASNFAQTSAFSYQGRLSELGSPVSGTRYFRFTLYDEGGVAVPGATVDQTLMVISGVFNTAFDFGPTAFPGSNRFLEIGVKVNPGDPYTILAPRQQILSAPYSMKSKVADTSGNAFQLGGVAASGFVQQDGGGNVSIGGNLTVNGTATYNIVNAATQYNLGGHRIVGNAGNFNLFVGNDAGPVNTGTNNTFVGNGAGFAN